MRARRIFSSFLLIWLMAVGLGAQKSATPARGGFNSIEPAGLQEWLSYVASDELQGRQIYSEGLGLAAAYVADHLKEWGVKPAGENGSYFQTVKVLGVRTTSKASVTVEVNGQTRTFKDGEGIRFPRNMGGKQTITSDQIQFVGYGLQIPSASIDDYANVDPKGKVIVYLGTGPKTMPQGSNRLVGARATKAVEKGAIGVIGPPGGGFGEGEEVRVRLVPRLQRPLRVRRRPRVPRVRRPQEALSRRPGAEALVNPTTAISPQRSVTTCRSCRHSQRRMTSSSFFSAAPT